MKSVNLSKGQVLEAVGIYAQERLGLKANHKGEVYVIIEFKENSITAVAYCIKLGESIPVCGEYCNHE